MPRFFSNQIKDNLIAITGEDARHIKKVLRMRVGDELTVTDMQGTDYLCRLTSMEEELLAEIISSKPNDTEPSAEITLYQALPKSDKLEFIVQKAVELGAVRIVPMSASFCVAKADRVSFAKKLDRYNKIAFEAAKQCGRGIIPVVENIISFEAAVKHTSQNDCSIICYEGCADGGSRISSAVQSNAKKIGIFVGSEGGFDTQEVALAIENGVLPVGLGRLILRCETAPIVAITLVLSVTGNM